MGNAPRHTARLRRVAAVAAFVGAFGVGDPAESPAFGGATLRAQPLLHEYFDVQRAAPQRAAGGAGAPTVGPGQPADAATTSGAAFDPNQGGPPALFGGQHNGPPIASDEAVLDRDTREEGLLQYTATFDPSVVPYKRESARSEVRWVGGVVSLVAPDGGPMTRISVGGPIPDDHDRFEATFHLAAVSGEPVAFPSVAPNMHVHRFETHDGSEAELSRDAAGNYFARFGRDGLATVSATVSAPSFYFGGPIPERNQAPGRPRVPAGLDASAERVIAEIPGVPAQTELQVLEALVAYFRAFDARPLAATELGEDAYLDVALARAGVCRHRAMAFVITAQALGLSAQYVHNEAHAFAEVRLTGLGWRRVDLGGAAAGFEAFGADRPHQPQADPFGDVGGPDGRDAGPLASEPVDDAGSDAAFGDGADGGAGPDRRVPEPSDSGQPNAAHALGDGVTDGDRDDAGADEAGPSASRRAGGAPTPPGDDGAGAASGSDAGGTATAPHGGQPPPRVATRITLTAPSRAARGAPLRVRGRVESDNGDPIAGARVDILVGASMVIATVDADDVGRFDATVTLPPDLLPGRTSLTARFGGDDTFSTSSSE